MITLKECRKWVSDIDRSALGSFAIDAEKMARYRQARYFKEGEMKFAFPIMDDHSNVVAEFLLWHQKENGKIHAIKEPEVRERFEFLKNIIAHPRHLRYFEEGIFGAEAIERYIAAGIDPMLAKGLYEGL